MSVSILIGDCRARMAEMPDASVDSVVCDPPYHLTAGGKRSNLEQPKDKDLAAINAGAFRRLAKGFMGQEWDGGDVAFQAETWAEVLRVLKPGGHLIAFSGTRTYHRMAVAIEDAGFEIRDQLAWVYGSGFPKSHNLEGGLGTALKPAWEPICLARKPLIGSVAQNVLTHGTGALNIDGCRIEHGGEEFSVPQSDPANRRGTVGEAWQATGDKAKNNAAQRASIERTAQLGRWPANLCHDGSEEVLAGFPETSSGSLTAAQQINGGFKGAKNCYGTAERGGEGEYEANSGSAARFFYCAKATTEERGEGNTHPTVKPIALMRWLVRLVTPKGGTVLDPFSGSGSTLIAADMEQLNAIGCELSPEYAAIAEKRLRDNGGMFADVKVAA